MPAHQGIAESPAWFLRAAHPTWLDCTGADSLSPQVNKMPSLEMTTAPYVVLYSAAACAATCLMVITIVVVVVVIAVVQWALVQWPFSFQYKVLLWLNEQILCHQTQALIASGCCQWEVLYHSKPDSCLGCRAAHSRPSRT